MVIKRAPVRFYIYADIKENSAKVIIHLPKAEIFDRIRPLKGEMDGALGFDTDWESKNGSASYRKIITYSFPFSFWEKDRWTEAISLLAEKMKVTFEFLCNAFAGMEGNSERNSPRHISEEEFMATHKSSPQVIEIYHRLCSRITETYPDEEKLYAPDYTAYKGTRAFVEIHIYKDRVRLNLIERGQESSIGERLDPQKYNWPLMYKVELVSLEDIPEAMRLIALSYNAMKMGKGN